MSADRKNINPLLNISVTGGTIEDFTQNAVLLPAAEITPPPVLETTPETEVAPQFAQDNTPAELYSYNQLDQQIVFDNFVAQSAPLVEEELKPPSTEAQNQSSTLQSVFSSFSSYLNLNPKTPAVVEEPIFVPSVVDSLLGSQQADTSNVQPVTFYTPQDNPFNSSVHQPPTAIPPSTTGTSNTYRRGGLKRPTYAPIPGLSANQPALILPQQQLGNLPPLPPQPHSQFPNPIQNPSNYFQPELSGYATSAESSVITTTPGLTPSPKLSFTTQTVSTTSPILKPRPSILNPIVAPAVESLKITESVPTYSVPFTPPAQANYFENSSTNNFLESHSTIAQPISTISNYFNNSTPQPAHTAFNSNVQHFQTPQPLPTPTAPPLNTEVIYSTPSSILTPIVPNTEADYFAGSHLPNMSSPNLNNNPSDPLNPNKNILNNGEGEGTTAIYRPVYQHWFYKREIESKVIWTPFTMLDSLNLEQAYLAIDAEPDRVVATDGGRFDVNILRRERTSVYWNSSPSEVRRCSWFHKGNNDGRYVPYEENTATRLEEEYKIAHESNTWNRKVELVNGESVIFHGPDVLVLFPQQQTPDAWGNTPNQPRPRVVKRGMDEFHIEEGESTEVDHLLFLVHGIGSVCDLKFRSVEEVVDEFRSISMQLVQSHYRSSCETGVAHRVEVLPISWHEKLHSEDTGVDKKLKGITLESIPRLRDFTNDTILDVLFYTSPVYCQTIISSVGNELNRIYDLFLKRNSSFKGGVSLGGHSLGSLILFDLLCHQHPTPESEASEKTEEECEPAQGEEDIVSPLKPHPKMRHMSRRISYMMGAMGTGQAQINYPHLSFNPRHFFALGSPIGMFVTVRGLDTLGEQFALPTCPSFFNIFHPYDPVAYRIESLVNPDLCGLKPVLIPHHKGRKRMHLELKETMARVGADLKQKLIDSMKSTWNSFYQFTIFKSQTNAPNLEEEVDKVLEQQLQRQQSERDELEEPHIEAEPTDLPLGTLNQGRRIDYVLQEAPLEFFNEYIFALTSHVCYWESEDTMLLILKEIYNSMHISADSQIPQQSMTIERPPSSPKNSRNGDADLARQCYVDPTHPMTSRGDIPPPPMAGFVRKS